MHLCQYRVRINYRRILLHHNWSRKCHKIVKFVSITHSECSIWNDPIVAAAIGNITQDMLERFWREWEYCRTSAMSHVGRTSNAFKVTMKLQTFLFQMVVT